MGALGQRLEHGEVGEELVRLLDVPVQKRKRKKEVVLGGDLRKSVGIDHPIVGSAGGTAECA